MKYLVMTAVFLVASGCTINHSMPETKTVEKTVQKKVKEVEIITVKKEFTPQVWSGHKELKISESACAEKGMVILSSLGFIQVVKSGYGEYVYGNYSNNRAAIKCVSVNKQTFVYAIVAGSKVKLVEKLRNEIMWQF